MDFNPLYFSGLGPPSNYFAGVEYTSTGGNPLFFQVAFERLSLVYKFQLKTKIGESLTSSLTTS
jgi:hypothetical protein